MATCRFVDPRLRVEADRRCPLPRREEPGAGAFRLVPASPTPPAVRDSPNHRTLAASGIDPPQPYFAPMIIEGLLTTRNADGTVNIAPMGPIVDAEWSRLLFRPFPTSVTYGNLKRAKCGVFHVTDDVLMIARYALGLPAPAPALRPAVQVAGDVLVEACRWYELELEGIDETRDRPEFTMRSVASGRLRDFLGFNRARHAVLEATILATRLHLLDRAEVERQLAALAVIVDKTAGPSEREAFELVREYVARDGKSFDAED